MGFLSYFDEAFCVRLVLTLAHFVWQGALLALAAWLLGNMFMRRTSPRLRYGAFCLIFAALAVCPPITFTALSLWGGAQEPAPAVEVPAASSAGAGISTEMELDAPVPTAGEVLAGVAAPAQVDANALERLEAVAAVPAAADQASPASPGESLWAWRGRVAWDRYARHVTLLYLLGIAVMLARVAAAVHGGQRLRRMGSPVEDAALLDAIARHADALGLHGAPVIAYCEQVVVPTVVGVFRPMVLLPISLCAGLSPGQLELLLRHELAHIRRYDHLINILQRIVEAVLFFHPGVWYVSRLIRIEREEACDDLALNGGGEAVAYAESLLHLAEISQGIGIHDRHVAALSAGGRPSQLRRRILRLLEGPAPHARLSRRGVFALVVGAALALTVFAQVARPAAGGPTSVFARLAAGVFDETIRGWNLAFWMYEPPKSSPAADGAAIIVDEPVLLAAAIDAGEPDKTAPDVPASEYESVVATEAADALKNQLLNSNDWWLQKVAAQEMGATRDRVFTEALVAAFRSNHPHVMAAAAEALGNIGDPRAIQPLVLALKENDPGRVAAAAAALARIDDPQVMKLLRTAFRDNYGPMRRGAAMALGKIGTDEAIALLVGALGDEAIQQGVISALSDLPPEQVTPPLALALKRGDAATRKGALLALGDVGGEPAKAALMSLLDADGAALRRAVREALADFHGDDVSEAIARGLDDPLYENRVAAARLLERRHYLPEAPSKQAAYYVAVGNWDLAATLGDAAFEPLMAALKAEKAETRWHAAATLGRIGDARAIDALAALLRDPARDPRVEATRALEAIGGPDVVEPLAFALRNSERDVRQLAATALISLGDARAVEPLCTALRDGHLGVRRGAAQALGRIGDMRAAPSLVVALRDEDNDVPRLAAEALGRLKAADALDALVSGIANEQNDRDTRLVFLRAIEDIGLASVKDRLEALVPSIADARVEDAVTRAVEGPQAVQTPVPTPPVLPAAPDALPTEAAPSAHAEHDAMDEASTLLVQLQDEDWWLRKVAAQKLGDFHGEPDAVRTVVGSLVKALKDETPRVQAAAAEALGELGDPSAIKHLVAVLKEKDDAVRAAAADALARFDDPQVSEFLALAVQAESYPLRTGAVEALSKLKPETAVPLLIEAFRSGGRGSIRREAAVTLAGFDKAVVEAPLLAAIDNENADIAAGAAMALGMLGTDEARQALLARAGDTTERPDVRYAAVAALAYFRDDKAVADALVGLLADPDFEVRRQAGQALQKLNVMPSERAARASFYVVTEQWVGARNLGADAVDPLILALGSKETGLPVAGRWQGAKYSTVNLPVRQSAAQVLGDIGDTQAVPALVALLRDPDEHVRGETARALGKLQDGRAVEGLVLTLNDSSTPVRLEAASALYQIKAPEAFEGLIRALTDPEARVRSMAVTGLGALQDTRAAAALVVVLDDAEDNVANTASGALLELGESGVPAIQAGFDSLRPKGRCRVAAVLSRLGESGIDTLLKALGDPAAEVRTAAVSGLGYVGVRRIVPPLIKALDDPDDTVRSEAAATLGGIGDPRAVGALMALVERETAKEGSEPSEICRVAANALAQIGEPRALPVLKAAAEKYGIEVSQQERGSDKRRRGRFLEIGEVIRDLEEKAAAEAENSASGGSE